MRVLSNVHGLRLTFWYNIYLSQLYTYQNISTGHAALEERKRQRKQRERRENEDEVRIQVLAKARAKVPLEGLACEPGKDRVPQIRGF